MEAIEVHSVDDRDLTQARVGDVFNIKGKLAAVRYGGGRQIEEKRPDVPRVPTSADPSIVITCADWSDIAITVRDYATAKGIRIPLSTYVCVKAQKIHEDGDLLALAIWELGGAYVQPLGEPAPLATTNT